MSVANCPKCSQQLDFSSAQAGSLVRCPCGARLRTPGAASPMERPTGANPTTSKVPLGISALPANQQSPSAGSFGPNAGFHNPTLPNPSIIKSHKVKNPYDYVNIGIRLVMIFVIAAFPTMFIGVFDLGFIGVLSRYAGSFLGLVGLIFCISVPKRTKARPVAIAAVVCVVATDINFTLMNYFIINLASISQLDFDVLKCFFIFSALLSIFLPPITVMLFLLFLQIVAQFNKQQHVVNELYFLFAFLWFTFLGGFLGALIAAVVPLAKVVVGLAWAVAIAYWLIRFTALLYNIEFRTIKTNAGR